MQQLHTQLAVGGMRREEGADSSTRTHLFADGKLGPEFGKHTGSAAQWTQEM